MKKRWSKPTSRDILAGLFMAAWICVVLQGALRKWVFPGVTIIYLVQDVPLIMAYVYALYKGLIWGGKMLWFCVTICIVLSIQTMIQLIVLDIPGFMAVIGLHHYIFYVPILFLAPVCYNYKHRLRFLRWNMLSVIPMAMIATLQSRAPRGAWINQTSAGSDTAFGVPGTDVVRATGTFNFTLAYSIWCGFAVALVVGEWLLPPERRAFRSRAMLLVISMSALVATMVSGSRTAVLMAALAFLGGMAAVLFTRNYVLLLRFAGILLLIPAFGLVSYMLSPVSFEGNLNRFTSEGAEQDAGKRISGMTIGFLTAPSFSLLGKGIGYGIQAAHAGSVNAYIVTLSEDEGSRTVQELGSVSGIALTLVRYSAGVLLIFTGFRALQLPRGHRFPHAVPLAFSVVPTLMVGELVRSAPVMATQAYICIALICGAMLFRREPLVPVSLNASKMR